MLLEKLKWLRYLAGVDFSVVGKIFEALQGFDELPLKGRVKAVLDAVSIIAESTETEVDDQFVDVIRRIVESELFDTIVDLVQQHYNDDPHQVQALLSGDESYKQEFTAAGIPWEVIVQLIPVIIDFLKRWR